MRSAPIIALIVSLILVGCNSLAQHEAGYEPEPVMRIYHVKPGKEKELRKLLELQWSIFTKLRMVVKEPHLCILIEEDSVHSHFVETMCWSGPFAAEVYSVALNKVQNEIQSLCEARGGHKGVEVWPAEIIMR